MKSWSSIRDNDGFTLLDLAIALVVFGLLAAAFFSGASIYIKQQRIDQTNERLHNASIALARFIKDDLIRFPCPASLTTPPGAPGFGEQVCPANYDSVSVGDDLGGVFALRGADGAIVLLGALPTTTMKTDNNLMLDEYDNRFTYAVTMDLTEENALEDKSAIPPAITRLYKVELPDHTIEDRTANVDFILISHGPDGAGSYTQEGKPHGKACRITQTTPGLGDSRNCLWQTTFEATFRDEAYTYATAETDSYYDDMVLHMLGEDTKGWWQSSDGTGGNIGTKNPFNVGIGPGVLNPVQRVDVDGAIKIANTSNPCDASSVGSIRYNDGSKSVVECCNDNDGAGYSWGNISYGCAAGTCTMSTKGQFRFNGATGTREFCNGVKFISVFGANCSGGYYHGQIFGSSSDTETAPCDGGLNGTMTRSRPGESFCNNGIIEPYSIGEYGEWDRSACINGNPAGYEVRRFGVASGCNNDWSSCYRTFSYPAPTCASGTARGYACETHPGGCDNTDGTCCVVCN